MTWSTPKGVEALERRHCVEVAHVCGELVTGGVVDLEEDVRQVAGVLALQRDPRRTSERHREVAVHAAGGCHHDRHGRDQSAGGEAVAEEVAERHLDRWAHGVVPVRAQDEVAEHERSGLGVVRDREPDVPDHAGTVDLSQSEGLRGGQWQVRRSFAARTERRTGTGG
jgi:hypothetical protein